MGRAVIVSNKTGGLYRVKRVYNLDAVNAELAKLETAETEYFTILLRTLNTLELLRDEKDVTRVALNAVIDQWKEGLLANEAPPVLAPPEENDPDTGLPWDPLDKSQEEPLLEAVNAARTGAGQDALTRHDDLDFAARRQVYDLTNRRVISHIGSDRSTPDQRVAAAGYQADFVAELLAGGQTTAAKAATSWSGNAANPLFSASATEIGVAYAYAQGHPMTHLWVAVLAHPDSDPDMEPPSVTYPDDPAQEAAREQEATLDKIEPPRTTVEIPEKLGQATAKFAEAAAKLRAAERDYDRLLAEKIVRSRRIVELDALRDAVDEEMDAWACQLIDQIPVGTEVGTADPPGYSRDAPISAGIATIYANTARQTKIAYEDHPFNIAPFNTSILPASQLHHSASMGDAQVFLNAAIEAGHHRWKPIWRYATLTAVDLSTGTCSLNLEVLDPRLFDGEKPADFVLDDAQTLTGVAVSYPPCNIHAFEVGDQVLVLFEGFARDHPKVIGFRRAPRDCSGRTGWTSI